MSKFDKVPLPYEKLNKTLEVVKKRLGRDMTLSEKVLYSHLDDPKGQVSSFIQCYCQKFKKYFFLHNLLL